MPTYRCDNCRKEYTQAELIPLQDVLSRVQPGDFMPDGECTCGAAVFEVGGRADQLTAMEDRQKTLERQIQAAFPGVKFDLVLPQFQTAAAVEQSLVEAKTISPCVPAKISDTMFDMLMAGDSDLAKAASESIAAYTKEQLQAQPSSAFKSMLSPRLVTSTQGDGVENH